MKWWPIRRTYHWPTSDGWLFVVMFSLAAFVAGGWRSVLVMLAFFVYISVLGNVLLP
jgi:hypothetical protein